MAQRRSLRWLGRGLAATVAGATLMSALPAGASPWSGNRFEFASSEFRDVWNATDAAPGNRSLTWGPKPWFDYHEFYQQSPDGLRLVQYFDKARMEINNPEAKKTPFFVTNGLLPVEMISGRLKLGNGDGSDQYEQRAAAAIPVAGDPGKDNPDAPTYASFNLVATINGSNPATSQLGEKVTTTFDKSGNIGVRADLGDIAGTNIVQFNANTKHNVPAIFKNYMDFYDQSGNVGALFTFGYPITEPYWIQARVAGVQKDILVQIYERRVLTFTPSNPEQYQVEMGNVGQHYFQWRYSNLGMPWDKPNPYVPVAFGSNRKTPGHLEIYTTDTDGNNQNPITSTGGDSRPFSVMRSWDQDQVRIFGTSTRETDQNKNTSSKHQLWMFSLNGSVQTQVLSSQFNDYQPAVSPDGTKVLFWSDRKGKANIFMLSLNGGAIAQLTNDTTCVNDYPNWDNDSNGLFWNSDCSGNFEIWHANLTYTQDKPGTLGVAIANKTNLTNNPGVDRYPRVSPDGSKVIFQSNRDGNPELYVMRRNGQTVNRLTNSSTATEQAPTWSPDGSEIVYVSNAEGDFEVYIRNLDPSSAPRQLTNNGAEDNWPIYWQ